MNFTLIGCGNIAKKHLIENNTKRLIDGLEARKSVKLINAIYESAETGKEVRLQFDSSHSKLGK